MTDPLRVYFDPAEIGEDGYPLAWHHWTNVPRPDLGEDVTQSFFAIKDVIRERDGHRCLRCLHPYTKGMGQWSPCDERCTHLGPVRIAHPHGGHFDPFSPDDTDELYEGDAGELVSISALHTEAEYRILTVHHLNGVKHDCRWWNLVSLCQRCHLSVQTRVVMSRPYWGEHSEWFKPFVAAFYANVYLGEELTWEQTQERMEELLALEHRQPELG